MKYTLEPYKGRNSRFFCPRCEHRRRTFTRYINAETGEYLCPEVGRCDRQEKCGYHLTPAQYHQQQERLPDTPRILPQRTGFSTIPWDSLRAGLDRAHNYFYHFLQTALGREAALKVARQYLLCTSQKWPGASVFWQIDNQCRIRTGKIMLYHAATGKRVKEPYNHVAWVHTQTRKDVPLFPGFHLRQCFFGEHLLADDPRKPVAIVESEKTAMIAAAHMPQFIWLACGSKEGLNQQKCEVLEGRKVLLYPDLGAYEHWKRKGETLFHSFAISDELERIATEQQRGEGWDIADYLVKQQGPYLPV